MNKRKIIEEVILNFNSIKYLKNLKSKKLCISKAAKRDQEAKKANIRGTLIDK